MRTEDHVAVAAGAVHGGGGPSSSSSGGGGDGGCGGGRRWGATWHVPACVAPAWVRITRQARAEVEEEESEVWSLGRQAARGMAMVLGEAWDDGLLLPATPPPAVATTGSASAVAQPSPSPIPPPPPATAAAVAAEEAVPAGLGRVLRALQPPELRLFLRTRRELSDLYLPPTQQQQQQQLEEEEEEAHEKGTDHLSKAACV